MKDGELRDNMIITAQTRQQKAEAGLRKASTMLFMDKEFALVSGAMMKKNGYVEKDDKAFFRSLLCNPEKNVAGAEMSMVEGAVVEMSSGIFAEMIAKSRKPNYGFHMSIDGDPSRTERGFYIADIRIETLNGIFAAALKEDISGKIARQARGSDGGVAGWSEAITRYVKNTGKIYGMPSYQYSANIGAGIWRIGGGMAVQWNFDEKDPKVWLLETINYPLEKLAKVIRGAMDRVQEILAMDNCRN